MYLGKSYVSFYKKIETPPAEIIISELGLSYQKEIDRIDEIMISREVEKQGLLGDFQSIRKAWSNDLDKLKAGETPELEIYQRWVSLSHKDPLSWVDGKGLYVSSSELPNNLFDASWMCNGLQLFSVEETLFFIHDKSNECDINDHIEDTLKKFWEEYPDGMIDLS